MPDRHAGWRTLARSFPVISDYATDADLSDPMSLDAWADDVGSSSARHAAALVLGAWNSRHPWRVGKFDIFRALESWDSGQRAAFEAWVNAGCRRF